MYDDGTNVGIPQDILLPPNGTTARTISWGTGYDRTAALLYDGGAAVRHGWGLRANEMQFFNPTAAHFSWNKGGDFQVSGTNELMRLDCTTGNLGIGATTVSAKLHSLSTTEQLRLGYDAGNYGSFTVGSNGSLIVGLTGTTPTTTFSQAVKVPDDAYDATSWNGNVEVPTKNAIRDKIESLGVSTYYNSNVGSGYRLAIPNTNNIKTLTPGVGIKLDSAVSNEIDIAIRGYNEWLDNTVSTTDATATTLATITPPDNSRGILEVTTIGTVTTDGTKGLAGKKFVYWKKLSGTVTVLQVVDEAADYRETLTTATWTVDASSGTLRIRVTGEGSTNIDWSSIHKLKYNLYSL